MKKTTMGANSKINSSANAILVTGASSGIGWATSLELAQKGWRVFAAVRKEADAKKLRDASSGKITTVIMDIVDYESVKRGASEIEKALGGAGLDALFNNAGISVQGPLEILPIELFEQQIRVNVFGHIFVTQTFLPLLRKAQGRIVFTSSESGRVTLPLMAPYSSSKFALEAVASALRIELRPWKIRVSSVELQTIKTPMWGKIDATTEKLFASVPKQARDLYKDELRTLSVFPKWQAEMGISMKKAVRVIIRALSVKRPKARYLVGWEARFLVYCHNVTPIWLMDWFSSKIMILLGKFIKPK
ncbi:MAG TPA: SDR family oxidoreductase [Smithellaceae bacterium]|jgi:NAD(P)-dependent dehydrogenase (short-subunit alcohol dehydrogenase family)|nr:MAG: Diacetyl reductase ((S)-acetoin forming) [Deltaproteobacteria bacterium ADurb.Bin022]HNQ65635.1 SDR family oxidoreductase [Smithella sp.]HOX99470.1 SDR family oxidoreductase [Smithella sp.]HPL96069.1 SDR family oxidoreductase [Smithellaceae bacterium]HQC20023.1 SDR family oxidoreductase [Smithella sp.]